MDANHLGVPIPALVPTPPLTVPSVKDKAEHVVALAGNVMPLVRNEYLVRHAEMVQKVGATRLSAATSFVPFGEHPTSYTDVRQALFQLMEGMVEMAETTAARHGVDLPVSDGRGAWEWYDYVARHVVLIQIDVPLGKLLKNG